MVGYMVEDVYLFKIVIEKADVAKYSMFKSSSVKYATEDG